MVAAQKTKQKMDIGNLSETERMKTEREAMQAGVKALWQMGKLEVEGTTRLVCETVLGDKNISSKEQKQRCENLKVIGNIYKTAANEKLKAKKKGGAAAAAAPGGGASSGASSVGQEGGGEGQGNAAFMMEGMQWPPA